MEQKRTIWRIKSPRALGVALRDIRKEAGLTQVILANRLETTRHRISRLERGDISEQLLLMLRILERLEVDLLLEVR